MRKSVVIIEDDKDINDSLATVFKDHGYEVRPYTKAQDFMEKDNFLNTESYLIDWHLPDLNGVEVIQKIRNANKTAAVFLMSASNKSDLPLEALGVGADHFLKKPFDLDEMMIRFENAHKKLSSLDEARLDRGIKLLSEAQSVIMNGQCLKLTQREFKIFETLFLAAKEVSRVEILSQLITLNEKEITARNIDVHINSLRKKIRPLGISILTVRGIGYRMHVE